MKSSVIRIYLLFLLSIISANIQAKDGLAASDLKVVRMPNDHVQISMNIEINGLHLGRNQQLYVTPVLANNATDAFELVLPSVLINGRNMHYVFLRTGGKSANYILDTEVMHKNGVNDVLHYNQIVPLRNWMLADDVELSLVVDSCGCGRMQGSEVVRHKVDLDPARRMLVTPFPKPVVEEEKIFVHHGRARVQFEVDRTELHVDPYKCKRDGKILDNREQLQIIEDSLHYALNTPSVELHSLTLCGYASPESPFLHNVELASGRSKALLEYIEDKYHLPIEKCSYDYVPENWAEFRLMAADTAHTEISSVQREALLELIDRNAILPEEFDQKEKELKTSKIFKDIYKNIILPEWFPLLRCTEFYIRTHLKPMSDEQLREVLHNEPELLSLNQIYRVARLCEHGSEEFHYAMSMALKYYPDDMTANANAAALAIEDRRYDDADFYLDRAGYSSDVCVLHGILSAHRGHFEEARQWFVKAGDNAEALKNLKFIEDYE